MTVWDDTLPTLLAGAMPPAEDWQKITGALSGLRDARTSYTPSWTSSGTQPALVNGTLTGSYLQVGKFAAVRIVHIIGSSDTFGTGAYRYSLPVTPLTDQILGAFLNDASASQRLAGQAWIISASATGDNMRIVFSGESAFTNMTGTSPITLASGDRLILQGVIEVA